jgi:leader peptidase (prepilin peptidase) / N-methyltransferase
MPLIGLDYLIFGFVLFIGSAIGSFLNVCIHRMPLDQSIVQPSSYCPICLTAIRPTDNLPVIGWLLLAGKCRACRASISIRYPLVELVTGLAALGSVWWLGYTVEALALFLLFALLLPATLIDFDLQIIPNSISYPGIIIGLALSFFRVEFGWQASLMGAGISAVVLLIIRQLGTLAFRKEAMGLGDIKLIALIGAFVGWQAALISIFLGSILGTFYNIPAMIHNAFSGKSMSDMKPIPFGPFLAGGGLLSAILEKTAWWTVFWML